MALKQVLQDTRIFRHAYRDDTNAISEASGLRCEDPSRTDQSQAKGTDINELVRIYKITGQMPIGIRMPMYEDYEEAVDFHTANNILVQARESFMQLRSDIRDEFDNDPAQFLAFCAEEKNRKQLEEWGMAIPQKQQVTPEIKPEDKKSS